MNDNSIVTNIGDSRYEAHRCPEGGWQIYSPDLTLLAEAASGVNQVSTYRDLTAEETTAVARLATRIIRRGEL